MRPRLWPTVWTVYLTVTSVAVTSANTFQWNANTDQSDTPLWQRSGQQGSGSGAAVCVDIPSNVSLCQGIGYTKMRLPNLLNHETLREVSQQSNSWVPLSQLNCHPDTQLFLCSLFSPVCLDHPIPPCRSLCLSVQSSCEQVMLNYGYPWPKIVECNQFPIDNDMCIQAQHSPPSVQTVNDKKPIATNQHTENKHKKGHRKDHPGSGKKHRRFHAMPDHTRSPLPSRETIYEPQPGHLERPPQLDSQTRMKEEPQVDQAVPMVTSVVTVTEAVTERTTRKWNREQRQLFNNIINNFCRSQWILKARLFPIDRQKNELKVRNYRLIQGSFGDSQTPIVLNVNRTLLDTIVDKNGQQESQSAQSRRRYFLIGRTSTDGQKWVTFAIQWPHKSAQLRKAIKAINGGDYDCQNTDNSQHNGSSDRLKSRRNNSKD